MEADAEIVIIQDEDRKTTARKVGRQLGCKHIPHRGSNSVDLPVLQGVLCPIAWKYRIKEKSVHRRFDLLSASAGSFPILKSFTIDWRTQNVPVQKLETRPKSGLITKRVICTADNINPLIERYSGAVIPLRQLRYE